MLLRKSDKSVSYVELYKQACASIAIGTSILYSAFPDHHVNWHHGIKLRNPRKKIRARVLLEVSGVLKPSRQPKISPHFLEPKHKPKKRAATSTISPFFPEPFSRECTPPGLNFPLRRPEFGLIQERISESLFALMIQAILWNKTKGTAARPILWKILCAYPTPEMLASADPLSVQEMIRILGLQERRAHTLVKMAQVWVAAPPCPERRYGRRNYPKKGSNKDVKERELLEPEDEREGWEVAHLPGIGEYALDSYRIFGRDRLRGIQGNKRVEPEWKRVIPADKELGPYVQWKWAQEGWEYELSTGLKTKLE